MKKGPIITYRYRDLMRLLFRSSKADQKIQIQERQIVRVRDDMVMEHVRARFNEPIPPAKKGLHVIRGRDKNM